MEIKKKIYIYTCCIYYDHVNKCPGSILSCCCITHCASDFIIFILIIIIGNRSFSVITKSVAKTKSTRAKHHLTVSTNEH